MTKHIYCSVCENPKAGPLFMVIDKKGKHYVCKSCIEKLKNKENKNGHNA